MARSSLRSLLSCSALALALGSLAATAVRADMPTAFAEPVPSTGWFYVQAEDSTRPILPGSTAKITGTRLVPGQTVTLQRGHLVLNETAAVADEKGSLNILFKVPEDAAYGVHPLIVIFDNPSHAEVIELRVSKDLPPDNEAAFAIKSAKAAAGPYQTAYSARSDALFLAATQIRPFESRLQKLHPETLEVIAEITPAPYAPDQIPAGVQNRFAKESAGVFGLALDDEKGTIWVTNTLHNSVAVYSQDDLSLIRQFPIEQVSHSRGVVVDGPRGRAYVSAATNNIIRVYSTETLELVDIFAVETGVREGIFASMDMDVNAETGELLVVSRRSDELAVLAPDGAQRRIIPLKGARGALGVDYDEASGKAWVASQDSGNLLIVDVTSGAIDHVVETGSGALSVTFDPVLQQGFVANRLGATITVVSPAGEVIANLPAGTHANHVTTDGKGRIYAVNKSADAADPTGDRVSLITPAR